MKKKVILSILIIMTLFIITSCGKKEEPIAEDTSYEPVVSSKSVVLYFSATGTTKSIAERIASTTNSDIIEIIPKKKYTSADLNYNSDCRANREQNDSKARPEIDNEINIDNYDTIFLGYPIWWGTNPKIILTLLDTYDFSNKVIIPFCTSGSTDISGSVNDLRSYNPKLNIRDGKRFSSTSTDEEIDGFVNSNIEVINTVKIVINNNEYTINLEDNETVKSFIKLLPTELTMSELNGNEKYIYLDSNLPTNESNPKHINAGDVMLYGDNCLVIFYKSFDTSYSYTKIGHIDNLPDLGSDNIIVKFEK